MFMRVNARCAHRLRPPRTPGQDSARDLSGTDRSVLAVLVYAIRLRAWIKSSTGLSWFQLARMRLTALRTCSIGPRDGRILSTSGKRFPLRLICEGETDGFETL